MNKKANEWHPLTIDPISNIAQKKQQKGTADDKLIA